VLALATLDADADAEAADAELAAEEDATAEEEAAAVAEELAAADEEEPELPDSAAVAFLVPHFSSLVQVAWPSASLGWSAMHCMKVAWQI